VDWGSRSHAGANLERHSNKTQANPHGLDLSIATWHDKTKSGRIADTATVADNDLVSFEFDGALLRIRCGDILIPASARGQAWENRYTLRACQLKELPTRLGGFEVLFSVWNEKFHIANWSYEGVVVDKIQ